MVDEMSQLRKRVTQQAAQISELKDRMSILEQHVGVHNEASEEELSEDIELEESSAKESSAKESTPKETTNSVYKVFGVIGILLIVLGAVTFFKYAVDQGWIGIIGRIVLGLAVGLGAIFGGILLHKKQYPKFSQIIIAAGLGVTYFTMFATYHFQAYRAELGMTLTINTVLLLIIMGAGMLIAGKLNGRWIGFGSMGLGFLAAFLSLNGGTHTQLLIYAAIVSVCVIVVAYYKSWFMSIPAAILSYAAFAVFFIDTIESVKTATTNDIALTIFWLVLFYALYTVVSFIQAGKNKFEHMGLSVVNTSALASFMYFTNLILIKNITTVESAGGLVLLLVAVLTLGVGYLAKQKGLQLIVEIHALMAIIIVGIAIPVQFDYTIVTILWVLSALGLAYAGYKTQYTKLFLVGYFGYIVPLARVLFYDLWFLSEGQRFVALAVTMVGIIILQQLALRKQEGEGDAFIVNAYAVVGVLIGGIWIAREITDHLSGDTAMVVLSIAWAGYAIASIFYGVTSKRKVFNILGMIIFAIVIVKILVIDMQSLEAILRVAALVATGVLALVGSFLFVKNRDKLRDFI